jgi:RND family efflux transporter MFP subunit
MKRRTKYLAAGGVGIAALAAFGWVSTSAAPDVPTARVERGSFVDAIQIRGEIKAGRSVTIIAPSDAGELRIMKLVRNGTSVKKGDTLIEFDGTTVARTVDEKKSEVRGFEAQIEQSRSESRATQQKSLTEATTAEYDVSRAELDYSAKEILSRVEGEQRGLKVDDSKETLREKSAKLSSDRVAGDAKVAGVVGKRSKSEFDLTKAERQRNALTVAAPSDGFVMILRNWRSGNWMNPQDFKEGDRVWAGASIAELPDASSMFGSARVDEVERGRLATGQTVTVRVEALPDRELKGRVDSISALAKADFTTWPPPRNFDVKVALDELDERLKPGMTASIRIATETLNDVLLVPSQAIFPVSGADYVFVMGRLGAERRAVTVERRNADRVAIRAGLAPGDRVALQDPTRERRP